MAWPIGLSDGWPEVQTRCAHGDQERKQRLDLNEHSRCASCDQHELGVKLSCPLQANFFTLCLRGNNVQYHRALVARNMMARRRPVVAAAAHYVRVSYTRRATAPSRAADTAYFTPAA